MRRTGKGDAARQGAIFAENENGVANQRLAVAGGVHIGAEFEGVLAMPGGRRKEEVGDPLNPLGARPAALKKSTAIAFRALHRGGSAARGGIAAKFRERDAGFQQNLIGEIGRVLQAGEVFIVMLVGGARGRREDRKPDALVFLMVNKEAAGQDVGRGEIDLRFAEAIHPP